MAKNFYTFIVVPDASSRLHKLRLPGQVLYICAAIGLISFFVAVGLAFNYTRMAFKVADYNNLQAENVDLKIEKKNLEVSTVKLDTKLAALESLSERLTTLIEDGSWAKRFPKANMPAIGGSRVDYPTADLLRHTDLKAGVELMKDRASDLEGQMKLLEQVAEQRNYILRFTPNIWPVRGNITSHYGSRADPFNGEAELHQGLDISALYGSRVLAPADGIVIYAQRKAAYGNLIIVDHGNGLTTRHGHLSRFNVHVGQRIQKNEIIGFVGSTGRSTAPHLHYEVRLNDRPVNPRAYLPRS
ncbi:MAG TPA: M23 family metallopeptidase [Terriglobia bacterium]|nr:M23 family metallopeptidase [Terriglobia bacterium]